MKAPEPYLVPYPHDGVLALAIHQKFTVISPELHHIFARLSTRACARQRPRPRRRRPGRRPPARSPPLWSRWACRGPRSPKPVIPLSVKNHSSEEEHYQEDRHSEHRIRGWIAVSAGGLQGKGSPERTTNNNNNKHNDNSINSN